MGIEPTTRSLGSYCSTTELHPQTVVLLSLPATPSEAKARNRCVIRSANVPPRSDKGFGVGIFEFAVEATKHSYPLPSTTSATEWFGFSAQCLSHSISENGSCNFSPQWRVSEIHTWTLTLLMIQFSFSEMMMPLSTAPVSAGSSASLPSTGNTAFGEKRPRDQKAHVVAHRHTYPACDQGAENK
jgi:hypothetical protein